MSSKLKWFIAIGILINVLVAGGFYVNYRLDQVVASLNRPGLLFSDLQSQDSEGTGTGDVAQRIDDEYWNSSWGETGGYPAAGGDKPGGAAAGSGTGTGAGAGAGANAGGEVKRPTNTQIADDVMAQIGRPIDKTDMLKAGVIILKRLSGEEISYLYNVGRKGSMTAEERVKVKKILSAKLTKDDMATLKELGKKYGRNLTVLE